MHFKTKNLLDDICLNPVTTHELKNILSSAKLSLQMLTIYDFDKDDIKQLSKKAYDSIDQSLSIFEEMLQLERLKHEKSEKNIAIEDVNVVELLDKLTKTYQVDLEIKKIHLNFIKENDDITVAGSHFWLERLFYNLFSNAIKYNKENGTIDIIIKKDTNFVYIEICDSGIGISEGDKENIFKKFYVSSTSTGIGTGVGLTLVKAVVDSHNGKIDFDSTPNIGTKFIVTLPKKQRNNVVNPMGLFSTAASVLLVLTLSYMFPIIPKFDNISKNGLLETISLDDESKIQISKDGAYSFWHFRNLTGDKNYLRLNIDKGLMQADLRGSKVIFDTPSTNFTNMGTKLALDTSKDGSSVSVYEGLVNNGSKNISQGNGFAIGGNKKDIFAKLLSEPTIRYKNLDNGKLSISYNKIAGAEKYLIIIAKDDDFKDSVIVTKNKGNIFETEIKEDGYYFIKISAIDKSGIIGYPNIGLAKNIYHIKKGIEYRNSGNINKAIEMFELSNKEFKSKDYLPYSELGWSYYIKGEYAKSIKYFEQSIRLNPNNKDSVRFARALYQVRDYDKAENIYNSILNEDENSVDALWGKAEIMIARENISQSEKLLSKLYTINPNYPLLNYDLARVAALKGDKELAKKYLQREATINPENRAIVEEFDKSL